MFNLDLSGRLIACISNIEEFNGHFNTGVILYNLKNFCKVTETVNELLKMGQNHNVINADQEVMNRYFKDNFYKLSLDYNFQVGYDQLAFYSHHKYYFNFMDKVKIPAIIHYLTNDKPWKTDSSSRY